MRRKLSIAENRRQDPHWIENRNQGKITRRIETDSIQQFIEYAKGQGNLVSICGISRPITGSCRPLEYQENKNNWPRNTSTEPHPDSRL